MLIRTLRRFAFPAAVFGAIGVAIAAASDLPPSAVSPSGFFVHPEVQATGATAGPIFEAINSGSGAGLAGIAKKKGAGVIAKSTNGDGLDGSSTNRYGILGTTTQGGSGFTGVFGQDLYAGQYDSNAGVAGTSANGTGVVGLTTSCESCNLAAGVLGEDQGSANYGVEGNSLSGTGVYGQASSGNGVAGYSSTGTGIIGTSSTSVGVSGTAFDSANTGGESGIIGTDASSIYTTTSNAGVSGTSTFGMGMHAQSTWGTAILGESPNNTAVFGNAPKGVGVGAATDSGTAITARANSSGFGISALVEGAGDGVTATSVNGVGVVGNSLYYTGVWAQSHSDTFPALIVIGGSSQQPASSSSPVIEVSAETSTLPDCNGSPDIMSLDQLGNMTLCGSLTENGAPLILTHTRATNVVAYTPRTTVPIIDDVGQANLIDGSATVALDPAYASAADMRSNYLVYLTPEGDCRGLYIASKTPSSFVVRELQHGRSTLVFDYRIVAKPYDSNGARLPAASTLRTVHRPHSLRPRPMPTIPSAPRFVTKPVTQHAAHATLRKLGTVHWVPPLRP